MILKAICPWWVIEHSFVKEFCIVFKNSWRGHGEMGEMEEGEPVIGKYGMREESIFNTNK